MSTRTAAKYTAASENIGPLISEIVIASPGQSRAKSRTNHPKTEQNAPAHIFHNE